MLGTDVYAAFIRALLNGTAPRPSEGNGTGPAQSAPEGEASGTDAPEESEPAA
jgi:hypothetical protein